MSDKWKSVTKSSMLNDFESDVANAGKMATVADEIDVFSRGVLSDKVRAQIQKYQEKIKSKRKELAGIEDDINRVVKEIDELNDKFKKDEEKLKKDIEKEKDAKKKKSLEKELAKLRAKLDADVNKKEKELTRLLKRQEGLKSIISSLQAKMRTSKSRLQSLKKQKKYARGTSATSSSAEWNRARSGKFKNGRFKFNNWAFDVYVISFSYSWSLATKGSSQARQKKVTYPFRATQSDLNVTLQFESREKLLEFGDFARAYHEAVTNVAGRVGDAVPNMNFKLKLNGQSDKGYSDNLYIDYDVALPSIPIAQSNDSVAPTMRLTLKILRDQVGNLDYVAKNVSPKKKKKKTKKQNSFEKTKSKDVLSAKDDAFVSGKVSSIVEDIMSQVEGVAAYMATPSKKQAKKIKTVKPIVEKVVK